MFARAGSESRAAFLPYFPVGYPNYQSSIDIIKAMAALGVDGFEIGIPFSDPLADGPTIQAATQAALENGITVRDCLKAVRTLRMDGVQQPMLLMGYVNPLMAYGIEAFARDARAAGADGVIIPDLPPEEASLFSKAFAEEGLASVFFLAPTSNEQRIAIVSEHTTGFIYLVSLTGVTGARAELPPDLEQFIARVRAQTDKPLVVGFGISRPDQAQAMNKIANGFIVGSALVKAASQGDIVSVTELAASLSTGHA